MITGAGVNAGRQALDSLKTTPTYILLAALSSLSVILLYPPFRDEFGDKIVYIGMTLVFVAILTFARLLDVAVRTLSHYREARIVRERERLTTLYRPIYALLVRRRVEIGQLDLYPTLRLRLAHARHEFGFYKSSRVSIAKAFAALFDKGQKRTCVLPNGSFPTSEIFTIAKSTPAHASEELLNLISWAYGSREEDPGGDVLTDGEVALYDHITVAHEKLSKRFD